jgi:hypothetical protein
LKYRINTDHGLVRDGGSDHPLFFRRGHSLQTTGLPGAYECHFSNSDTPSVTYVTGFSGDPFNAHTPPPDGLGQLSRTEGKLNFHTFLAVVNKRTEAILTLAESHWTLTWDGTYDFASKTWTPNDPDRIVTHQESDFATTYENPRDPAVPLPFSLDPEVANQRKEVWTPNGWVACKEGLPDLVASQRGGH